MKLKSSTIILVFSTFASSAIGLLMAQSISPISGLVRHNHSKSQVSDSTSGLQHSNALTSASIPVELGIPAKNYFLAFSDQIFVGTVVGFTPSSWDGNRSGPQTVKEWENTSRTISHEVILKVDEPIMGATKGQTIKPLAIGSSPVASPAKVGATAYVFEPTSHHLKVGDQGIFFLYSKWNTWSPVPSKNQAKPYVSFINLPDGSYLPQQQLGRYRSLFPDDRKSQKCSLTPPANRVRIKMAVTYSPNEVCYTQSLLTVSDVQNSLKRFEPLRACIKPHTEAYARMRTLAQCSKKIKV